MANHKVVICDDKRLEAQSLRQMLEGGGIKVAHICSNGKELMEWLKENPRTVDGIILDIVMPVMDGYAAFFEVRKIEPRVKVVFVSIENSAPLIKNLLGLGAADFIARPVKRDTLIPRVKKALSRD